MVGGFSTESNWLTRYMYVLSSTIIIVAVQASSCDMLGYKYMYQYFLNLQWEKVTVSLNLDISIQRAEE